MRNTRRVEIDRRAVACDGDPWQPHHRADVIFGHRVEDAADVAALLRHQLDAGVHWISVAAQLRNPGDAFSFVLTVLSGTGTGKHDAFPPSVLLGPGEEVRIFFQSRTKRCVAK